ncbi:MAG: ATP-binding cassette domain-containing protein [Pseudobdellovibrionaceae bacterium]
MLKLFRPLNSLERLLLEVFFSRPLWKFWIVLSSLIATFFGLLGPFLQKEFVDGLIQSEQSLPYLLFSFLSLFLALGFNLLTNYLGVKEALHMQRVLAQRMYDHTLNLRTDSLAGRPVGEIVSLYATDIPGATVFLDQSLPVGTGILFPLILAPWALVRYFDIPLWPLLSVMSAIVLISFSMAFRQSIFFFHFKKLAADRIGLVSEWIQNIRTLRILGWVESFETKIFEVRKVETVNRIRMVTNGQAMNSISSSVTFLLNLAALGSLIFLSGKEVTTGTLLALLWIIGVFLTRPFRQMPWFFTFIFDSWTSLKRVDAFLSLQNAQAQKRATDFKKLSAFNPQDKILDVKDLNLSIGPHHLLKNISFEIRNKEFITIVGEVGSGKSLLLLSLLGETGASFGHYQIKGNDAATVPLDQLRQFFTFVPQEGFIMSASLRENVAFEYDVNSPEQDQEILNSLRRAQFDLSKERVEDGLATDIGERGVNLSGGQKQRVSLARVDFYRAPIILLDDCLSAVDVDTENLLLEELIKGAWKDRTRLLVTHRLTVLEKSDRVIFLQDGRLQAQGTFHELLATNPEFRQFAATVAHDESKKALTSQIQELKAATSLMEEELAKKPIETPENES